jgi:hypothetical protein
MVSARKMRRSKIPDPRLARQIDSNSLYRCVRSENTLPPSCSRLTECAERTGDFHMPTVRKSAERVTFWCPIRPSIHEMWCPQQRNEVLPGA